MFIRYAGKCTARSLYGIFYHAKADNIYKWTPSLIPMLTCILITIWNNIKKDRRGAKNLQSLLLFSLFWTALIIFTGIDCITSFNSTRKENVNLRFYMSSSTNFQNFVFEVILLTFKCKLKPYFRKKNTEIIACVSLNLMFLQEPSDNTLSVGWSICHSFTATDGFKDLGLFLHHGVYFFYLCVLLHHPVINLHHGWRDAIVLSFTFCFSKPNDLLVKLEKGINNSIK